MRLSFSLFSRMALLLLCGYIHITAADAVVVDPATGTLNAANATVNRTTPATGAEVVRGDDPRLGTGGYILLQHQVAGNPGTATAGSWITRALNTEVIDTKNACTLSGNQFTLAPGTYQIRATSPFHRTDLSKIRLRNMTSGTTVGVGTAVYTSGSSNYDLAVSEISTRFIITSPTVFEIQYYVSRGQATNGLGVSVGGGEIDVYTQVVIVSE